MKKESFEDYITGYPGLTAIEYMDVLQKYRECFAEEVDRRVNEQLDHVVAQTIIKLKMKLRHDIQQEECLMLINKISTYLQTLISLEGKTCYSESTHKKVYISKSSRLPTYDRLWNKIRKIQKEKGITASELANLFGLSERTLSRYDKSACPLTMEKLSNFLESIGASIVIVYK